MNLGSQVDHEHEWHTSTGKLRPRAARYRLLYTLETPDMYVDGPHTEEEAARFRAALERNATLLQVLRRAATMNLPGWYLAAGSLTQSVWNMVTARPPEYGIDDYDVICKCLPSW